MNRNSQDLNLEARNCYFLFEEKGTGFSQNENRLEVGGAALRQPQPLRFEADFRGRRVDDFGLRNADCEFGKAEDREQTTEAEDRRQRVTRH